MSNEAGALSFKFENIVSTSVLLYFRASLVSEINVVSYSLNSPRMLATAVFTAIVLAFAAMLDPMSVKKLGSLSSAPDIFEGVEGVWR